MSKIKRIIPFSWRNKLLGLSGDSYNLAEAEYYYDGEDLKKKKIELSSDSATEKEIKFLKLELEANRITNIEYSKERANVLKEPWVHVVSIGLDKGNIQDGYFELDWNPWFIEVLEKGDFQGSEEDIVNHWLQTVCQNIALEDMKMDEVHEEKKTNVVDKKTLDDGKAEYS